MARKLHAALICTTLASLCILVSCNPSGNDTSNSTVPLKLVFSSNGAKSLGQRAISVGKLGSDDTFSFVQSAWSSAMSMTVGNSANTGPGMGCPFYTYNAALGPDVSDGTPNQANSTNPNKYFMVTLGGGSCTTIAAKPMGSASGTFDEALLVLYSGYSKDALDNYYEFGPHFSIYRDGSTAPTVYGPSGFPGEKTLKFNGTQASNDQPYIFFVPESASGVTSSTGFSGPVNITPTLNDTNADDIAAVQMAFLDAVARAVLSDSSKTSSDLTPAQSSYWKGFFRRYCMGTDNGQEHLGGSIANTIIFEIIPLPAALDFGNGDKEVTVSISYNPSTCTYDDTTTLDTLDVTGTPPLNFSVTVSSQ